MREIVHIQAGQCGNQIGAKVTKIDLVLDFMPGVKDLYRKSPNRGKSFLVFN